MTKPEYEIRPLNEIRSGEEYRRSPDAPWKPWDWYLNDLPSPIAKSWVEVRPQRANPHPRSIQDTTGLIFTTVSEMRDRPDLDQWEVASFESDTWAVYNLYGCWQGPDDFPVIIRRKVKS